MTSQTSDDRIFCSGPAGPIPGYLAKPAVAPPWPGLLVIHENDGLTPHIEDVARRFAAQGYLALAPDLYASNELTKQVTRAGLGTWFALRRGADADAATAEPSTDDQAAVRTAERWWANLLRDAAAAVRCLRARSDCNGRVGSIGYCLGGSLSGELAATGADLQACIIYYGGNPPLDQVSRIRCAVQGHYGGDDQLITSFVPQLENAMAANAKEFSSYVYPAAPHAFFNDQRPGYHPQAAGLAWQRTTEFLQRQLGGE